MLPAYTNFVLYLIFTRITAIWILKPNNKLYTHHVFVSQKIYYCFVLQLQNNLMQWYSNLEVSCEINRNTQNTLYLSFLPSHTHLQPIYSFSADEVFSIVFLVITTLCTFMFNKMSRWWQQQGFFQKRMA